MAEAKLVDAALLKTLVPPSGLNAERFQQLAGKAYIEAIGKGKVIFQQGERDRKTCYLLAGEVSLTNDKGQTASVVGGTVRAKAPLANHQPRQFTTTAVTDCKIARFDSDLLDILVTWDQLSGIEVSEIHQDNKSTDGGDDWMTRMLQSKTLLHVPPANIQAIFMRIQEMPVSSGQVVIRQGDEGDYYYIIRAGKAKVTRASKTGADLTLAQLSAGDAFGEEGLLSGSERNATVTMVTDGVLMRLAKDEFNTLLKEPMLIWVSYAEAVQKIQQGALWLDVRLESEHKQDGIEGSVNLPLFMLRLKVETLDPTKRYVVYCDTGRRSSAAAFLLRGRGFEAYVLQGGLATRSGPSPRQ